MQEYSYTSTHPLGHSGPATGSLYIYHENGPLGAEKFRSFDIIYMIMDFLHMRCIRLSDLLNSELYNTVCVRDDCLLANISQ